MIPRKARATARVWLGAFAITSAPMFLACEEDSKSTSTDTDVVQQPLHDDGIFELDGNPQDDPNVQGDDWDRVLLGDHGSAETYSGPIADLGSVSIFTGGGSKDPNAISQWRYRDGAVPDKDNITNAYAAAYIENSTDQDLLIYFGADRFATSGDSQIGFWFFKNPVGLNNNGTFSGSHAVGDILVLSDFTQGGAIGTVKVFEWVGSGGSDGSLNLIDGGAVLGDPNANVFCLQDDFVCGSINKATIDSPWPYTPKSGGDKKFAPGAFFEGGINATQLVAGDTCFSSFIAETRSSQSPTATLKDFVLGEFETCAIEITKTCEVTTVNPSGSDYLFTASYTASITNPGPSTLPAGTVLTVVDDAGTPNDTSDDDTKTVTLAAALKPGDPAITVSGTFQTNTNPPTANKVTVTTTIGGATVTDTSPETACTALPLAASLTVCKTCNTTLKTEGGQVIVGVEFSGNVCNPATSDVSLAVSATDSHAGTLTLSDTNLAPGECATFSGSYEPTSSSETDPLEALFTDTVTATGTNGALGSSVTGSDEASCGMCVSDAACP